jgi:hypothetical protein
MSAAPQVTPPDALSGFLHFGYLPGADEDLIRPLVDVASPAESASLARCGPKELLRLGAAAMRAGFAQLDAGLHVVPLTGGLDSRAVLALLIDGGVKDKVVTVTMGTPGTFDYEIGRRVARRAEVPHERIDLTQIRMTRITWCRCFAVRGRPPGRSTSSITV